MPDSIVILLLFPFLYALVWLLFALRSDYRDDDLSAGWGEEHHSSGSTPGRDDDEAQL